MPMEMSDKFSGISAVSVAFWQAGATERTITFSNNDRPGIMLAGAVRTYVNRFGASPGKRIAIFTNNDDGWATAKDLHAAGVEITAIIDTRPDVQKKTASRSALRAWWACCQQQRTTWLKFYLN